LRGLWNASRESGGGVFPRFQGRGCTFDVNDLAAGSILPDPDAIRRQATVVLATGEQLPTALALLELDGVVRRVVLCPPELTSTQLAAVASAAGADFMAVSDSSATEVPGLAKLVLRTRVRPARIERSASQNTEWVLLTSGTTGMPKLVVHTLDGLAGALLGRATGRRDIWSTFYDIRRYGGLQIYLRAVLSGAPLVLSSPGEPTSDFLERVGEAGVTHISGTPSHWRRALMSGSAHRINPSYVRLSGEIADQSVLDLLRQAFPAATIVHAFASTEAGVGFEVTDGLAGFPASFVSGAGGPAPGRAELRVFDGTLRLRSPRTAAYYLCDGARHALAGEDGYVDTGDLVELVADRYYFRGRQGGVINVGGLKVYPEEVEAVLNADPRVRMSLVRARRNPITGAIAVAEVVPAEAELVARDPPRAARLIDDLLSACRRALPAHKVPALVRLVASLEVTDAGKLVRPSA
jgi:acyl-coenzyme A synthetase/AMP-(fatty) acid ligase